MITLHVAKEKWAVALDAAQYQLEKYGKLPTGAETNPAATDRYIADRALRAALRNLEIEVERS